MEKQNDTDESTPSKRQKLMSSYLKSSKASSSVHTKKELDRNNSTNKLLIDYEKRIIIISPLSIEVNRKYLNVDDVMNKCHKFISMSSNNDRLKEPAKKFTAIFFPSATIERVD